MMKLVTTEVAVITLVWVEWSMCSMSSIRVNLKFNTTTKYGFEWISVKGIQENIKNVNSVPFLHICKVSLDLLELTFVSISFYEENS